MKVSDDLGFQKSLGKHADSIVPPWLNRAPGDTFPLEWTGVGSNGRHYRIRVDYPWHGAGRKDHPSTTAVFSVIEGNKRLLRKTTTLKSEVRIAEALGKALADAGITTVREISAAAMNSRNSEASKAREEMEAYASSPTGKWLTSLFGDDYGNMAMQQAFVRGLTENEEWITKFPATLLPDKSISRFRAAIPGFDSMSNMNDFYRELSRLHKKNTESAKRRLLADF